MTWKSFPWGGTTVGDAVLAPYDDDEWSDLWRLMRLYDRMRMGVVPSKLLPNPLAVTFGMFTTQLEIAPGTAIVDGKIVTLDEADDSFGIDGQSSTAKHYRVVLRKDFAAQTVRPALLGPDPSAPPVVTQVDGVIWEISLATVVVPTIASGLFPSITDTRVPVASPLAGRIKISEVVVSSPTTTITFSDIPPLYQNLQIIGAGRLASLTSSSVELRLNGVSGPVYSWTRQSIDSAGNVVTAGGTGDDAIALSDFTGNAGLAGAGDSVIVDLPAYRSPFSKTIMARGGTVGAGSNPKAWTIMGWMDTGGPITEITLIGGVNFMAGTSFTLYAEA